MPGLTNALRDYWHPVAFSSTVGVKPVSATLLNEHLVLWRSKNGVVAFKDLCIHRGTRLSLGWIEGSYIVCPYHGWNYRERGLYAHPLTPGRSSHPD